MPGEIDFYFDFLSPYSYLAYQELPALAARHGWRLVYHPVELNELKLMNNNTGPSSREQPLKSRYNAQEFRRWSRRYGVTIARPSGYDPESRLNKGAFLALDRGRIHDYIVVVWRRSWGAGGNLAAVVCLLANSRQEITISHQVLLQPVTDFTLSQPSTAMPATVAASTRRAVKGTSP